MCNVCFVDDVVIVSQAVSAKQRPPCEGSALLWVWAVHANASSDTLRPDVKLVVELAVESQSA